MPPLQVYNPWPLKTTFHFHQMIYLCPQFHVSYIYIFNFERNVFRVLIFYIWKMGFELLIDFWFIVTKVASWIWIWNWNYSSQITYYCYSEIMGILTSWLGFQIEILVSNLPLAAKSKPNRSQLPSPETDRFSSMSVLIRLEILRNRGGQFGCLLNRSIRLTEPFTPLKETNLFLTKLAKLIIVGSHTMSARLPIFP